MVPADTLDHIIDPVEALNRALESAWLAVCQAYDVNACLPEMQNLFAGVNLDRPQQAAQSVLVAMLLEVIECTGRFSPWYKLPARAFGLVSAREPQAGAPLWALATEAVQRWQGCLQPLVQVVRKYSGLIQAMILVDDLMQDLPGDPCVMAQCSCTPPHTIQIRRSVLDKTLITCHTCMQPFV